MAKEKLKKKTKVLAFPPDEKVWIRYSRHHELPISSVSSILLHALAFAILIVGGMLLARYGNFSPKVDVSAIVIAGGGGDPDGTEGPDRGTRTKTEAIDQLQGADIQPKAETRPQEVLSAPDARLEPLVTTKADERGRLIEDSAAIDARLNKIREARKRLDAALAGGTRSKGKGGPGEGGGLGTGKGKGTGDLSGEGVQQITQRKKRQQRWIMIFNTRDGEDYLRQLTGLKAILGVPARDGGYLFIEDLSRRPVELKQKELGDINRIYWIDDKPESVASLAFALKLDPPPSYFVAFFPEDLEKELLDKELAHKGTPENRIVETRFTVRRSGTKYEPMVKDQRSR